jgi:hypothetical protein
VLRALGLCFGLGFVLLVWKMPVQALPTARVGILGHLDSDIDEQVVLTLSLPTHYGLTAFERRAGWEPLNKPYEVSAVAVAEPFQVLLPRVQYCVTQSLWDKTPPPMVWLNLTFADNLGEQYVIFGRRGGLDYVVRNEQGLDVPKSQAGWTLDLGDLLNRGTDEERVPVWLLEVHLKRQVGSTRPERDAHGSPSPRAPKHMSASSGPLALSSNAARARRSLSAPRRALKSDTLSQGHRRD